MKSVIPHLSLTHPNLIKLLKFNKAYERARVRGAREFDDNAGSLTSLTSLIGNMHIGAS